MALRLKDTGGTLRTITNLSILDGATPRTLRTLKVMGTDNVTLRTVAVFAAALTLATSGSTTGVTFLSSTCSVGPITATPTGGLAPFTYVWAVISGTCTISGGTSASATFIKYGMSPGITEFATVRCTCTDSAGQVATVDVDLTFEFAAPYY